MKIIDNLQDPGQEMDFGLGDYFDGDEPEDSDSQQPDDVSDDSLDDVNEEGEEESDDQKSPQTKIEN